MCGLFVLVWKYYGRCGHRAHLKEVCRVGLAMGEFFDDDLTSSRKFFYIASQVFGELELHGSMIQCISFTRLQGASNTLMTLSGCQFA